VIVVEYWFDEEPQKVHTDILRYKQRSAPVCGIRYEEFYTILIDLELDEDALLAGMKKETRYEIRRASQKDSLVYECCNINDVETVDEYRAVYNRFAVKKGMPNFDERRLNEYSAAGFLNITRVRTTDGRPLVYHVYFRDKNRVRLLNSASDFRDSTDSSYRSLVGRANRYHHWKDMLRFKAAAVSTYDFGGWYAGDKDLPKLSINSFKEEFGGRIVKNFNQELGITAKGKLALLLRDLVQALRSR
jgi:hypothetical protein